MDEDEDLAFIEHTAHQVSCHAATLSHLGADIWVRAAVIQLILFFLVRHPEISPVVASPALVFIIFGLLKRLRLICIFLTNHCSCDRPANSRSRTILTLAIWIFPLLPAMAIINNPWTDAMIGWSILFLVQGFCAYFPVLLGQNKSHPSAIEQDKTST